MKKLIKTIALVTTGLVVGVVVARLRKENTKSHYDDLQQQAEEALKESLKAFKTVITDF